MKSCSYQKEVELHFLHSFCVRSLPIYPLPHFFLTTDKIAELETGNRMQSMAGEKNQLWEQKNPSKTKNQGYTPKDLQKKPEVFGTQKNTKNYEAKIIEEEPGCFSRREGDLMVGRTSKRLGVPHNRCTPL